MSQNAIVVENLSKRYLIGHRSTTGAYKYTALRDVIGQEIRNFVRKAGDVIRGLQVVQGDEIEEYWALKDVNFQVKQGEVLGIVGRNGAGKSTLLKVLSRITEPSDGRVTLHGRVASLLEVGTGFHPELTGRENIFLNGAILGMTQREIRRKFDEIVDFAEVDKFLDTPVKRYSSGMYVRLAFAVAAHLEPEILIVDEVLAVGDADFQNKCLGKMDEVSRKEGRTILFVSHNMEAVFKLCTRAMMLHDGHVVSIGEVASVVSTYLHDHGPSSRVVDLVHHRRLTALPGKVRLTSVSPSDPAGSWSLPFGERLSFDLTMEVDFSKEDVDVIVGVYTIRGFEIVTWTNRCSNLVLAVRPGTNVVRIEFEHMRLLPGKYFIGLGILGERGYEDAIEEAVHFEIVSSPEAARIGLQEFGGPVVPFARVAVL